MIIQKINLNYLVSMRITKINLLKNLKKNLILIFGQFLLIIKIKRKNKKH